MKQNWAIHAAGSYLAMGELLKRGAEAYASQDNMGKNRSVVLVQSHNLKRIKINTIDWPSHKTVTCEHLAGFDAIIIVLLDSNHARSRFYVFPIGDIGILTAENPKMIGGSHVLMMSQHSMAGHLERYEDNWDIVLEKQGLKIAVDA